MLSSVHLDPPLLLQTDPTLLQQSGQDLGASLTQVTRQGFQGADHTLGEEPCWYSPSFPIPTPPLDLGPSAWRC